MLIHVTLKSYIPTFAMKHFMCFKKERPTKYMSDVHVYVIGIYFSSQMPQTLQNASFPYMLIS